MTKWVGFRLLQDIKINPSLEWNTGNISREGYKSNKQTSVNTLVF